MLSSSPGLVVASSAVASACLLPVRNKPAGGKQRSLSCKATGDDGVRVDRRDVLLGITGVGAAATSSSLGLALAQDAGPQCAVVPIEDRVLQCVSANGFECPGEYDRNGVVEFSSLPRPRGPPRVRKAAHMLTSSDLDKFEEAMRRMKALPASDPRSFKRQSDIHEAYCASHYKVVPAGGGPETVFDVHYSSIFAPWHRMYIYFFEDILGNLIDDPTFGLPYWNWDAPEGMVMPAIFNDENSPLYDANRNKDHIHSIMDINLLNKVKDGLPNPTCKDDSVCLIENNLFSLYRQMVVDKPVLFYGGKFCNAEVDAKGNQSAKVQGSLENGAHTAAHVWLGDPNKKRQDMGDLSTAARDPVFYSNHSNVDRMWHIYSTKLNGAPLPYQEWLDTSFVFYDAQKRAVRIRVSDVLDAGKLGYKYEENGKLQWLDKRSKPATDIERPAGGKVVKAPTTYPITLNKGQQQYLTVGRPMKARAGGGSKKQAPEVLVVDVTIDPCEYVKFDVLVNVPKGQEEKVGPKNSEYAGSFTHVPHGKNGTAMEMNSQTVSYQFALRELLEDLKCGKDSQLDVTLVSDSGDKVIVNDARIELL